MKKAMAVLILCSAVLSSCAETKGTEEKKISQTEAVTTAAAVSETIVTTTVTTTVSTETKEEEKVITGTKPLSVTTGKESAPEKSNTKTETAQKPQTHILQWEEQIYCTEEPQTESMPQTAAVTEPVTTAITIAEPKKTETTTKRTEERKEEITVSRVEWSDSMKAWRKLCEGKEPDKREQSLIRNEIIEYARKFDGRKDIHVSFGNEEADISYEKNITLTAREDMTDLSYAHSDAYMDADRSSLINYAQSEEEIYDIVMRTREECLHLIDYGLFNRWEIFSCNGALRYASDIEYGVGFDGTALWFLTED